MVDSTPLIAPKPSRALLVLTAAVSLLAGCAAPIALAEVPPVDYEDVFRTLPEGSQNIQLLVQGDTILRGAYVPPAEGGPLVLHLLESGGSIARGEGGRGRVLRELADIGIGSLMLDWSGVGVSSGTRENLHLRRDGSAMWREALRLVDGDPSRIILRSTSLGTLAAASLIERGARPGAMIMIAPVRAETAHKNFARDRYGSFFGTVGTLGMGPLFDVDLIRVVAEAPCPLLVLWPEDGDMFITETELKVIEQASTLPTTRFGRIPGGHVVASLRARSVLPQEHSFLEPWIPVLEDARARAIMLHTQMPAEAIPDTLANAEVQRRLEASVPLLRTQNSEYVAAAGLASVRAANGARLLALLRDSRGRLPAAYDDLSPGDLIQSLSLSDPAGELPLDLLAELSGPYTLLREMGGMTWSAQPTELLLVAWAGGAGVSGATWSSGLSVEWLGPQSHTFDHASLWRSLVERGLSAPDARRQMYRILLLTYGHAHRLRPSGIGKWTLEVWADAHWIPIDLETQPARFHPIPGSVVSGRSISR